MSVCAHTQILVGCSELCSKLRGKREEEETPKREPVAASPTSTDRKVEGSGGEEEEEEREGEEQKVGRRPPEELFPVSQLTCVYKLHELQCFVWIVDVWNFLTEEGEAVNQPPLTLAGLYTSSEVPHLSKHYACSVVCTAEVSSCF